MNLKFLPAVLLMLLNGAAALAQAPSEEPLNKLVSQTQQYQLNRPYEKIHLHLDKPYYAIGDDIWFKAYVVQAESNQPSNLSKILYVDLINEKDSIERTLKLPLFLGLAWGEFALSETLKEGNYRVRAYTNWMRNFGEEYFFDKNVPVANAITNNIITTANYAYLNDGGSVRNTANLSYKDINGNPVAAKDVTYSVSLNGKVLSKGKGKTDDKGNLTVSFVNAQPAGQSTGLINTSVRLDDKRTVIKNFPVKAASNEADVRFFPEGGELVAGLGSRIAFKATGADGRGIAVTGYVTDNANEQVANFKSEHAGMGVFALRPQSATKYQAVVKFEDGSEKKIDLPAVQPKGHVLLVNNTDQENLGISISASQDFTGQELILLAQSNNKIQFVSKIKLNGTRINSTIPKSRFPEGILHLTLFTARNEPVAERLVFINHQAQLKIDVAAPAPEFGKREKVNLSLKVADKAGNPVVGSFSLSVVDEAKVPYDEDNERTIMSDLLLTSDLKGYVESPNYYFNGVNEDKIRHLDNLMLTQGWRRFTWKNILNDTNPPLAYKPEQGVAIGGQVKMNGKPVANGKVTLFYIAGKPFLADTLTDAEGRFRFDNLYFPDSTKVVVQARNAKDRKFVEIQLDQVPPQLVTRNKNSPDIEVNINKTLVSYLKNSVLQFDSLRRMGSGSIMLDEVAVVEKKEELKNSSNLNGAGNADAVILGSKLEAFCQFDLSQCLQGLVTGLIMRDGVPYLSRSLSSSFQLPTHMMVMVDGLEVDPDYLSLINAVDVEGIEVLKSAMNTSIYGTKGVGGVLLITMKRGEYVRRNTYTPGLINANVAGYHKVREFYSPNYNEPNVNPSIPDLRTTIYWNPDVVTGKDGKALIGFFNADGTGSYKVIVEGINGAGNIGRTVYRYKVK